MPFDTDPVDARGKHGCNVPSKSGAADCTSILCTGDWPNKNSCGLQGKPAWQQAFRKQLFVRAEFRPRAATASNNQWYRNKYTVGLSPAHESSAANELEVGWCSMVAERGGCAAPDPSNHPGPVAARSLKAPSTTCTSSERLAPDQDGRGRQSVTAARAVDGGTEGCRVTGVSLANCAATTQWLSLAKGKRRPRRCWVPGFWPGSWGWGEEWRGVGGRVLRG